MSFRAALFALTLLASGCASRTLAKFGELDGSWRIVRLECGEGEMSGDGLVANTRLKSGEYRALLHFAGGHESLELVSYAGAGNSVDRCEGVIESELVYHDNHTIEVSHSEAKFRTLGHFDSTHCLGDNFFVNHSRTHHFDLRGNRLALHLADSQPIPQIRMNFCRRGQALVRLEKLP